MALAHKFTLTPSRKPPAQWAAFPSKIKTALSHRTHNQSSILHFS